MPVASSAFHWQPVRSTKRIAFIAERSGTRGLWQPSGCFRLGGSSGSITAHSSSGILQPSSLQNRPIPRLIAERAGEGRTIAIRRSVQPIASIGSPH